MYVIQRLLLVLSFLALANSINAQWINEIHYDNDDTDVNECIEIVGEAGTDMSCYSIVLYNGNTNLSYDTDALTGQLPDEGCGYGAVSICYTITGGAIQNGNPDGIALFNTCTSTIIQFLSYGGTFTPTNGPASGILSIDIGVTEAGNTLASSLQLTGSGSSYSDFTWQTEGPASSFGFLNSGQTISPCNTIATGAISGGPFSIECSTQLTDAGSLDFTSSGLFNAGNTYTAQLSDESGSFGSPINIGTLESVSNIGSISFTIPFGLETGTYRIRIISSDPLLTGTESADFDITQANSCPMADPHLTSVIINSCAFGACPEGDNEILFGNTGSSIITMNTSNFEMTYGSNANPTITYTDPQVSNYATTINLNSETGCSGTFIDANNTTIPPFSSFMLVHNDICPGALDWGALCSAATGPIYIIYSADDTWDDAGNYGNGNSSTPVGTYRHFQTTIIDTDGNSNIINYSYDIADLDSHADGDYILFEDDGGLASAYGNNGCTIDPVVLSSEIINFRGEYKNKQIALNWKSITEFNNDYFTIYHSIDGFEWNSIGDTPGHGNSISELYYGMIHERPESGLNYYQLHSTDFDGTTYNKATIAVNTDISFAYFNITNNTIELEKETDLEIYSTDGRLVYKNAEAKNVLIETKGMFILVDLKTNQTERIMIH